MGRGAGSSLNLLTPHSLPNSEAADTGRELMSLVGRGRRGHWLLERPQHKVKSLLELGDDSGGDLWTEDRKLGSWPKPAA